MSKKKDKRSVLEKKLDDIVQPLYASVNNLFAEWFDGKSTVESLEINVKEMLSIAVLQGIKLSDGAHGVAREQTLKSKLDSNMATFQKAKDHATQLNLNFGLAPDGKPRYVTSDQIDPTTGKIK